MQSIAPAGREFDRSLAQGYSWYQGSLRTTPVHQLLLGHGSQRIRSAKSTVAGPRPRRPAGQGLEKPLQGIGRPCSSCRPGSVAPGSCQSANQKQLIHECRRHSTSHTSDLTPLAAKDTIGSSFPYAVRRCVAQVRSTGAQHSMGCNSNT